MQYIDGLHFNNIRGDIFGGLTDAVVALPPGELCAMLDREGILNALPMHYRHIGRLSTLRFLWQLLEKLDPALARFLTPSFVFRCLPNFVFVSKSC